MQSNTQSKFAFLLTLAFVSAQLSVDLNEFDSSASTLFEDPTLSSDLAQFPSTAIEEISSANPIIQSDLERYASLVVGSPEFSYVIDDLSSVISNSVQSQLSASPADFIVSLASETDAPAWVAAIPTDVAIYLKNIDDQAPSIIDLDLAGPTATLTKVPGPSSRSRSPNPIRTNFSTAVTISSLISNSESKNVTTKPIGTGIFPTGTGTGAVGAGTGTSTDVLSSAPKPTVSEFVPNSASQLGGMAVAAIMAIGVGTWLLA